MYNVLVVLILMKLKWRCIPIGLYAKTNILKTEHKLSNFDKQRKLKLFIYRSYCQ